MSPKSKATAFLLCNFFGLLGVHRFYLNKVGTGILMLLTAGGFMIWWLVDMVLIASGRMQDRDGDELHTSPPDPDNPHAGFWVRVAAMTVDYLIVTIIAVVFTAGAVLVLPMLGIDVMHGMPDANLPRLNMALVMTGGLGLLPLALVVLYFTVQTASRHQATIGKRCFDIRVTTRDGGRPGPLRSLWRSVCYVFSSIPLYLGFVIAGFTRNKRALHDYMAGTQVMYVGASAASHADALPRRSARSEATSTPSPAALNIRERDVPVAWADESRAPSALMLVGALLIATAAALALLG